MGRSDPGDRDAHALAACWCGRDHLADAMAALAKPAPRLATTTGDPA